MTFSVLPHRDLLGVRPGRLLIGDRWVDAADGRRIDHIHPSTNETISSVAEGSVEDVDRAVRAARQAFDEGPWPRMKARERRRMMSRIVSAIEAKADELSKLQILDNGMPVTFATSRRVSGWLAADIFDHYAGWIDKITGEVYPQFTEDAALQFMSFREPVGVVGAIIPWNAPLLQFSNKVAPALAAGCTVVVKPSELGSLVALRLAEIIASCDLPPGVLNIVTGGPVTGEALVNHPLVDKITFTGSKAVGSRILSLSGRDIKRVTLELGGKSAAIVFPDAPSVEWASMTVMSMVSTMLSGQICSTTSRALVHRSIVDDFLGFAQRQVREKVRFGDPFDTATTSAPMINKRQVDKVLGYVAKGQEQGAQLVFGGDRPDGSLAAGNWINPTLFANVTPSMAIAREEIFGPVLSVIPFDTEEEAVKLANDSEYGLSGAIYTTNVARALRVGKALRTGTVGINGYGFMPNSPFGGFKQSGLGREGSFAALEAFTELKTLIFNTAV